MNYEQKFLYFEKGKYIILSYAKRHSYLLQEEYEELIQEGYMLLWYFLDRYNPDLSQLSTFVYANVIKQLDSYLIYQKYGKLAQMRNYVQNNANTSSASAYQRLSYAINSGDIRLDAPITEDETPLINFIAGEEDFVEDLIDSIYGQNLLDQVYNDFIDKMLVFDFKGGDTQQFIIMLMLFIDKYFGIQHITLIQIADSSRVSRITVSRWFKRFKKQLHLYLAEQLKLIT